MYLQLPQPKTACQLGFHSWEVVMPVNEKVREARCTGGCGIHRPIEEAALNRRWQDRQMEAKRARS